MPETKIIVLSAPSGAGKSTIARAVLDEMPEMRFSVSATTRPPRQGEVDGEHYHFLSEQEFRDKIAKDALVEYEEVYPGRFYGTLRAEVEQATAAHPILLDVDVEGAMSVKARYGEGVLAIFVKPPSEEVLARRLKDRGTETGEALEVRLRKARHELAYAKRFDAVVINDDLSEALAETLRHIRRFLEA